MQKAFIALNSTGGMRQDTGKFQCVRDHKGEGSHHGRTAETELQFLKAASCWLSEEMQVEADLCHSISQKSNSVFSGRHLQPGTPWLQGMLQQVGALVNVFIY